MSRIKNYSLWLRLGLFVLTLLTFWLPFFLLVHVLLGNDDPNLTTIVTMAILFIIFLILVPVWGKKIYGQDHVFRHYGLVNSRRQLIYLAQGIGIGFALTSSLFAIESLLGWVSWQSPSMSFGRLIFEGSLTGLGVAFAEELFFRGWLLSELERDFSDSTSSISNAIVFATLHFIKPLTEIIRTIVNFPALVLLGYILVVAKRTHKNLLGLSIGLHGGLVWAYYIINVGQMVEYNNKVPVWITGIDNNPIAGVMGLIFLSGLLFLTKTGKI